MQTCLLFLLLLPLVSNPKYRCQHWHQGAYPYVLYMVWNSSPVSSLACDSLVFLIGHLLKRMSFPQCIVYSFYHKLIDYVGVSLSWALFLLHWPICQCLCQYYTVLIWNTVSKYTFFVIQFKIRRRNAPNFVALSEDCFGYCSSIEVLELFFLFLWKMPLEFW